MASTHAADIALDITKGRSDEEASGGYFELGISLSYYELAPQFTDDDDIEGVTIGLALGGAYRFRRAFFEASEGTFDGLNLGYTLVSQPAFSVDFLLASIFGNVIEEEDKEESDNFSSLSETERDERLLQRDTLYSGIGIRTTAYLGSYVLQLRLVKDVYDDAGTTSTLRLGRGWQYKNWNFHSVISAEYFSADTQNYLYGITAEEATTRFPEYQADSGVSYSGEIGLTYPVSKNWVFRSSLRYQHLHSSASDSPLVEGNSNTAFYNSLSYVF